METGKKPQSHGKKVGEGSVSVNKTEKVDTGSKPVGSGGRTPSTGSARPASGSKNTVRPAQGNPGSRPAGSGGQMPITGTSRPTGSSGGSNRAVKRAAGGGGSMLLLILVAYLLLRGCSGGTADSGYYTDNAQSTQIVATAEPAPTQVPATTQQTTVSANARAKRYVPLGNGRDTVTVMVYMCGTDLESSYGMATSDLQEMINATIGSNVNVIVETGGCKLWKNKIVSASTNQIYKVESGGVRLVQDNIGSKSMVDPATLTEFIQFCQQNYPADRNILIFWDHGGGSITGYGYDELYKNAGSMDLAEINTALTDAGCVFDWIGFDACLMATLETALVCNDYADYLIASEETEPGTGWHYTGWLTALSQNTSIDTVTLSKTLIDDFISASGSGSKVTLSVVDLAEMQGTVPAAFNGFSTSTAELISSNNYASVSNARAGARQFAQSSRINQIDLVDFANRIGTAEAQALSQALQGCIKYNRTTISNAYGMSIFFPYETTSSVKPAISTYNQVGMDEAYTKCISSFASLASSGQLTASAGSYASSGGALDLGSILGSYLGASGSSYGGNSGSYGLSSPLGALLGAYTGNSGASSAGSGIDVSSVMQLLGAFAGSGRSLPADMDWVDTDLVSDSAEYIAANYIDPGDIFVSVRPDGQRVLSLTDEQWALIQSVELNVFVDDGEGFIDLGLDNVFEFDGNDLLLDAFDGTWLTVNGHIAAFYMDSADDDATVGHIPAMLTHTVDGDFDLDSLDGATASDAAGAETVTQFVYLDVVFDDDNPYGVITGARPMYDGETDTVAKGDIAIIPGDVIDFLCDYYTYDNQFDSAYKLGEPLTVGTDGLEIIYYDLGDADVSFTYRLTDIYNNYYWTPAV